MKPKVIEYWSDRGFNVVIEALFETNGADVAQSMAGYVPTDCVWINFHIYNPIEKKLYSYDFIENYTAYAHTRKEKVSLFKKKKIKLTLYEAYEEKLDKARKTVIRRVDSDLKHDDLNKRDQRITDGLPDSLKSL